MYSPETGLRALITYGIVLDRTYVYPNLLPIEASNVAIVKKAAQLKNSGNIKGASSFIRTKKS